MNNENEGAENDQVDLEKPPITRRRSRPGDDPADRAMWRVLHEQGNKLQAVDRDLSDMKLAINNLAISHAVLNKAVENIDQKLDLKLQEQFIQHEKREMEMQNRIMARGLLLLISALGAMAYFILSKVSLAMAGGG